ncbi:IniB N-terminal domain-containing protein [Agromyces sp. NPDC056965]|uniref:IniB N-terminal domain-containing protein n=1 Tax=Agromyces sp. NPDC056965 TaxID=3345983 RepID=UPI003631654A
MSTPVTTIADALIAFILSLLRDPDAVAEFNSSPQQALANHGLQGACGADVKAVAPVIIDDPSVTTRAMASPQSRSTNTDHGSPQPFSNTNDTNDAITEISRIINQFTTIDNRSTIIDQSTNQNIWANGDVTQIFDQDAVVASGDDSVAAGGNAAIDESDSTITTGDITVGNTTGSNNTTTTDTSDETPEDATDAAAETPTTDAAAATPEPSTPVDVEAQPEALMSDLTATDAFAPDEPISAPEPEPYPEEPAEEQ